MILKQLFDQDTGTYTYLLADKESREAIIIDPVVERIDRDLKLIQELGLELVFTLDTHVHADHITGSGELRRRTGARSGVAAVAKVPCADRKLVHGERLQFGRFQLEVRATPGHTDGCLTYVVEADGQTLAFTGDALFIRGCGRTDFQQGDSATLYRSVHEQIYTLPADTVIYPGHDYRGHTKSTVTEEKLHNPRLNTTITEAAFVAIMKGLRLNHPKRIHEALPANLGCGLQTKDLNEPRAKTFGEIQASQAQLAETYRIIDVRSPQEFHGQLGHIPGACSIPLDALKTQALAWSRDESILLVCRSGRRSYQGCEILTELGFSDVKNLAGGMLAWRKQQEAASC